ncbi:hypothetical protein GGI25_003434 [Coemansia spiralis]|uniref:Transforming acidic coiled-coil-containing protein C-terminal domain-containing protein n=1 Tax=Coemansia spiralis TaxID=417178 RepID=A0A9W8G772_9FUNG|nr:hypothetical protein GGI26_004315 [Coemansia sp. RSA 1358]KAJ2676789.1 hypothetical protein GGI25_003434 [Coemansia spiralis]
MDEKSETPSSLRKFDESNLALQSPPMLAQSPLLTKSEDAFERPMGSMKRTRADIATPRKPGSDEARMQEEMSFINTPARAPPAMKRLMRNGSPVSRRTSLEPDSSSDLYSLPPEHDSGGSLISATQSLSVALPDSATSPPKFDLANIADSSNIVADSSDKQPPTYHIDVDDPFVDDTMAMSPDVTVSETLQEQQEQKEPGQLPEQTIFKGQQQEQKLIEGTPFKQLPATAPKPESPESMETDSCVPAKDTQEAAVEVTDGCHTITDTDEKLIDDAIPAESDSEIEFATESMHLRSPFSATLAVDSKADAASSEVEMEDVQAENIKDDVFADNLASPRKEIISLPSTRLEQPELTTAKILSDPELMYAAAIPLPSTPALNSQTKTPIRSAKQKDSADFYIPTDWLMDMSPSGQHTQDNESSLKHFSSPNAENDENLIPVTPANQKLLDSLEIQWMTPRRVPKFSEADMEEVRAEYEEKMKRQNELREKLLETLKEEYASNMRKQQDMADQALKEAEEMFQTVMEHKEREFADKLAVELKKQSDEFARRDEESRVQVAELLREINNSNDERALLSVQKDEVQTMLDEYEAASTKLLEDKEAETMGLTRELGKLTLERQRLQEQLEEANAHVNSLAMEGAETANRVESLITENARLEELSGALRNDVLVAEERSAKIKEYAEGTLAKANTEIANLHERLTASQQEAAALKLQSTKAEARVKSLQIQLDSAKRQNEELLALCNNL